MIDQLTQLVQVGKESPLVLCLALAAILSVSTSWIVMKLPSMLKTRQPNIGQITTVILNQSDTSTDTQGTTSAVLDRVLPVLFERERNDHTQRTSKDT